MAPIAIGSFVRITEVCDCDICILDDDAAEYLDQVGELLAVDEDDTVFPFLVLVDGSDPVWVMDVEAVLEG